MSIAEFKRRKKLIKAQRDFIVRKEWTSDGGLLEIKEDYVPLVEEIEVKSNLNKTKAEMKADK